MLEFNFCSLTFGPVFMVLRSALIRACSIDIHGTCSSYKVVFSLFSPSWEWSPVTPLHFVTEIGVMHTGKIPHPGPDMFCEQ